jgi:hypothetical protein
MSTSNRAWREPAGGAVISQSGYLLSNVLEVIVWQI